MKKELYKPLFSKNYKVRESTKEGKWELEKNGVVFRVSFSKFPFAPDGLWRIVPKKNPNAIMVIGAKFISSPEDAVKLYIKNNK